MSLENVFTLLALLVAIYTLMPRSSKLSLILKTSWYHYMIVSMLILLYMYLQLYSSVVKYYELKPDFRKMGIMWLITPNELADLIVLFTVICLIVSLRYKKMSIYKVAILNDLAEELLKKREYWDLINVIKSNFTSFTKIFNGNTLLLNQRRRVNPDTIPIGIDSRGVFFSRKPKTTQYGKIILHLSNRQYKAQKEAIELYRLIILNNVFIESLITLNPYFGLQMIKNVEDNYGTLSNMYFRELFRNHNSIVYTEIRNNLSGEGLYFYQLHEENRILYYLLKDFNKAHELGVWNSAGEFMLENIRIKDDNEQQYYNDPLEDFEENGRWSSQLYLMILFFDIISTEAIRQNYHEEMFLNYHALFIEALSKRINNYNADHEAEFPNKNYYLISEIINNNLKWIESADKLYNFRTSKFTNCHVFMQEFNMQKDAIYTLGQSIEYVIKSSNIVDRLKKRYINQALTLYFKLKNDEYAKALIHFLLGGLYSRKNKELCEAIENAFRGKMHSRFSHRYNNFKVKEQYLIKLLQT